MVTPVSGDQLRKAFYEVLRRSFGEGDHIEVLRVVPEAVLEFCDTDDAAEIYSVSARVIGLVRILSSPGGRRLSRVAGSADMERAIGVASGFAISDDLRFNETAFWDHYAKAPALLAD